MNSEKNNIGENNTNSLPQMGMTTGNGNISNFSNFNNQVSNVDTKNVSVFDLMDNFNAVSSNNQSMNFQEPQIVNPVPFANPVQNAAPSIPEQPAPTPVSFATPVQNAAPSILEQPAPTPVSFTTPVQNAAPQTLEQPAPTPVSFTAPMQNAAPQTPEQPAPTPVSFTTPVQNAAPQTLEQELPTPVPFTTPIQNAALPSTPEQELPTPVSFTTPIQNAAPPSTSGQAADDPFNNVNTSDLVSISGSSSSGNEKIETLTQASSIDENMNSLYVPPTLNDAVIESDDNIDNSILTNVLNTNKTTDSVDSNKKQKKEKKQKGKKKKIVVIMIMLIAFIVIILSLIACYFMFMKQDKLVCSMEDYSKEDFNFTEEITVNFKGRTMSNAQLVEQMDFTEIGLPKMDSYVTDAENQFDGLGYEISYVQGPTDFKIIMNFTKDNLVSWTGIDLKSTTKSNFKQELQNKGYTCK